MPEELTSITFQPHVGSSFVDAGGATFELVAVTALPPQPGAAREEPFALAFTGPAGLPQQIYELEHEALGTLGIFLVPTGAGRYEAVFN